MNKEVRTMMATPTETVYLSNRSSPTPVGLRKNKHSSKLVPLNVVDSAGLGQTEGPLAVAPGFIPTAFTDFLGICLLMDTLLSLHIVGRSLDLSQSNVASPL